MSFGLGRGKPLDVAPGQVAIGPDELGPLPDDLLERPDAAWIDPGSLFPEPRHPFEIEIGSGKGTFLLAYGESKPQVNLLGIEWAGEFFAYTADRVRRRQLPNVRVLHGDATEFIRWRVPTASVGVIHLYFSDPWPKARHHKKRVIQHRFLADAWRVLVPDGELRVVTDHADLWAWDCAHFDAWCSEGSPPDRTHTGPMPAFAMQAFEPPPGAGAGELVGSNFERKFRIEGRSFHSGTLRALKPMP